MSYLDTFKRKRSSSRGDTTLQSAQSNRNNSYSLNHNDTAVRDLKEADEKHRQIMRENKLRMKRLEEESLKKQQEEELKKLKILEEKKLKQKQLHDKFFKPNSDNAEKVIEKSMR
jgi:hypothetical protein